MRNFSNVNNWGNKTSTTNNKSGPQSGKKGEINELKNALMNPSITKNQTKKRELLKKVIEYATIGLDTSKLFETMILCVNTKDIVQKKIVYQYLTSFSHKNSELAILTINTLSRDCRDTTSPLIRGLALRSLSQLKVAKIDEHMLTLINEGLNDPSQYVRKTAVTSVSKLYRTNPKLVHSEKLIDRLYNMLRDKDISVIINSINTINEIEAKNGGLKVTKKLTTYFLTRIHEFNEWELVTILGEIKKYETKSDKEIVDIMNLLDDRLQLANSAVVLGISDLFLHLTENLPKIHFRVYSELKDSLLLLYSTSSPELSYSILKHIRLMITRVPKVFEPHFKDFFIRHSDPPYLKIMKLDTITLLANTDNVAEIMEELKFYVTISDNDKETSRAAIRALGQVAVKIPSATEPSLSYLLDFLEMEVEHILAETFIVLKDILRKYHNDDFCSTYLPVLTKYWKIIDYKKYPQSLVAFIWILGEYGEIIKLSPYIIETLSDDFLLFHHSIRNEILSSSLKLFFKRPPEMQIILGPLLETAISDVSHADVHDRALFYYRLLKSNIKVAKEVVLGNSKKNKKNLIVKSFTEEESLEYRDKMFSEFNSLSIVYGKPAERFIIEGPLVLGAEEDEEEEEEEEEGEEEEGEEEEGEGEEGEEEGEEGEEEGEEEEGEDEEGEEEEENEEEEESEEEEGEEEEEDINQQRQKQNLLEFGGSNNSNNNNNNNEALLFGINDDNNNKNNEMDFFNQKQQPIQILTDAKSLPSSTYQNIWQKCAGKKTVFPKKINLFPNYNEFEKIFERNKILCLASSTQKKPAKFYFYGQMLKSQNYVLLFIQDFDNEIECTIKHQKNDENERNQFIDNLKEIMKKIIN